MEKNTISQVRYSFKRRSDKAVIYEVVNRLQEIIDLKDSGDKQTSEIKRQDLLDWLDEMLQELEEQITSTEDKMDISMLPGAGEIFAEGNGIALKAMHEDEREDYMEVSYDNAFLPNMYEDESYCEMTWNSFRKDYSYVCSIYDIATKEFIGYCAINNKTKDKDYELVCELKTRFCHKGYGTKALRLFMKELSKRMNIRFFCAKVNIDNYPSQAMMRKLGGVPNGIREFLLHGEEIEKFREENKDMIDERMQQVAEEFCMDAEDLLGYVLEYRFDMKEISKLC